MAESKTRQMTFSPLDDGSVRADFGEGIEPFTFIPAQIPESLFPQALTKGVITRLQGYSSRLSGEDRTGQTLRDAIVKGWADLMSGIWAAERAPGALEISIEAEAAHVFRVKRGEKKGVPYTGTLAESAEAFAALDEEKQKALKALALYKVAYAEVKARRAAEKAAKLARKAEVEDDSEDF